MTAPTPETVTTELPHYTTMRHSTRHTHDGADQGYVDVARPRALRASRDGAEQGRGGAWPCDLPPIPQEEPGIRRKQDPRWGEGRICELVGPRHDCLVTAEGSTVMGWKVDQASSAPARSIIMERVTAVLHDNDVCVLGTVGQHGAQLTPCFFAPLDEHHVAFVSSKGSGHVANLQADPRCTALILPGQTEPGRLVSLRLSGAVICPQGRRRLAALTTYVARMKGRIPSAARSVHDLLDKKVFILETESIGLLDTHLHRGTMRLDRTPDRARRQDAA